MTDNIDREDTVSCPECGGLDISRRIELGYLRMSCGGCRNFECVRVSADTSIKGRRAVVMQTDPSEHLPDWFPDDEERAKRAYVSGRINERELEQRLEAHYDHKNENSGKIGP